MIVFFGGDDAFGASNNPLRPAFFFWVKRNVALGFLIDGEDSGGKRLMCWKS